MEQCPSTSTCPFFNDQMQETGKLAETYKKIYCLSNFTLCARYMVSKDLGKENVPADLYPYQQNQAKKILFFAKNKK